MIALSPKGPKEQVVENYLPLVKHIASRISLGKTKYIEYEDLVSYGIIGLIDAMSKFDASKGVKFSSYAALRIRGNMIDEIRKQRPISKGAMDKLAKYNECIEQLQCELMREPTNEEIMFRLKISNEDILEIEGYINYMSVVSLENVLYSDDDEVCVMGIIEDHNSPSPEGELENKEKLEVLASCIEMLKEKDRLVLNLYYYEELTLKEIGKILEVSESRVCQLHSRAIKNLRLIMQKKYK
ncbi:MAG: FliA/WhiG family RNA polymerase sigma factor [Clostridium sp.]